MSWNQDDRADIAWEWIGLGVAVAGAAMGLATAFCDMRRAQVELAKSMMIDVEFEDEEECCDGEEA